MLLVTLLVIVVITTAIFLGPGRHLRTISASMAVRRSTATVGFMVVACSVVLNGVKIMLNVVSTIVVVLCTSGCS